MEIQELNTAAEAAIIWRVHKLTVRNWIYAGKIPVVRIGRRVFIRRDTIEKVLSEGLDTKGLRSSNRAS